MNLNGLVEFIMYQKRIRDREGNGLGCKEQSGSGECDSKFFCFDRENRFCRYNRLDDIHKRMNSYNEIVEYYKVLGYKIDI